MSDLYIFGLADVIAGVMMIALTAYVLTGGADFGGGMWDLLASGPRRERQRDLIARSLAPIWEANHVWLIVVVVLLFTAFPPAFRAITTVLHIPLTAMLVGIVLRGSAFVFRSYGAHTDVQRHRWGTVFAVASTITPLFLGMCVGAIASGRAGDVYRQIGSDGVSFQDVFVAPWLAAFPIAVGFFAVALFAFLAAVYLALAATGDLQEEFRRRALAAAFAVFIMATIALTTGSIDGSRIAMGLSRTLLGVVVQIAVGLSAITAIAALWSRRYRLARLAAGAQACGILWGWAIAQFPYVVPETMRIQDVAAPRATLVLLAIGLLAGAAILIPALRYLYRLFARPTAIS